MSFTPYVPDMGSIETPHHGSAMYPNTLDAAMQRGRNNIAMSSLRLEGIALALTRVGLHQLAHEITNEVDDLMWTKTMLDSLYYRHLEDAKKKGST